MFGIEPLTLVFFLALIIFLVLSIRAETGDREAARATQSFGTIAVLLVACAIFCAILATSLGVDVFEMAK